VLCRFADTLGLYLKIFIDFYGSSVKIYRNSSMLWLCFPTLLNIFLLAIPIMLSKDYLVKLPVFLLLPPFSANEQFFAQVT